MPINLNEERQQANAANEEGQDTLKAFKDAGKLAGRVSQRERGASRREAVKNKVGKFTANKAADLAGARETLKSAQEFRKLAKNLNTQQAIRAARQAAWAATELALKNPEVEAATFGLSRVGYEAVKHWRVTIALIIILFSLFFWWLDPDTFDPIPPQDQTGASQPTTNDTCTPAQFTGDAFGKISLCTITVTYNGSADNITITDTILPGTAFVSAGQNGVYYKDSNTVIWDAKQINLPLNPVNITVTVTVRVNTHQLNVRVYNAYAINPVGLSGSNGQGNVAIPGNLPPNANTCSGIYAAYMSTTPGHQNYGDPTCSLVKKDPNGVVIINKDAILAELKTLKPSEAMAWFTCVVPNESSYNANAYLGASTSGKGAYGLVQMNPTGAGNGQYDNGQVVWPLQLSNGINYNDKVIGHTFSYWPTSYDSCISSYGVTVN